PRCPSDLPAAAPTPDAPSASRTRLICTRRVIQLMSAHPSSPCFLSPRSLRGRTGLDAAEVLVRTGGEAGPGGLERGLAAGEGVRLRGGEALIEGRAAAR